MWNYKCCEEFTVTKIYLTVSILYWYFNWNCTMDSINETKSAFFLWSHNELLKGWEKYIMNKLLKFYKYSEIFLRIINFDFQSKVIEI